MSPVLLDMDLRGYTPATGSASVAADDAVSEPAPGTSDEIELMFVLHRSADAEGFRPGAVADALRTDLDDVGNSVVVVGGGSEDDPDGADSLWQAHVHAPDLAEALAVARRWARRGEISHVYVRHLAVPPADWAVVVTTSAPALAGELARGGAVVLLDLDTTPTVDDLAQTILGAGTPHVLVLADPALAGPALDDAVATLAARGAAGEQPDVVVVPAASDAHLACAVSALADASDASGPSGDADLPGVARAVLGSLRTARDSADRIGGLLEELMADCDGDPGIVAILPDTDVAPAVVDQLTACAERAADGADVVVLPTGRPGALVAVGVEPADPAHEPAPGAVTGAAW